ncbi:hypothetical protein [Salana multivorans]
MKRAVVAAGLGGVLVLTACTAPLAESPESAESSAPASMTSDASVAPVSPTEVGPLPAVDVAPFRTPYAVSEQKVVETAWQAAPATADGVFLGLAERSEVVELSAVSSAGEVLWVQERALVDAGCVVTVDGDGRALAVLSDAGASESASGGTTATAYDLHTGAVVWGPVPVPGPLQGPGLVFGLASGNEGGNSAGDSINGDPVALDAATGEVVAGASVQGVGGPVRILGEYGGTVLLVEGADLVARSASSSANEAGTDPAPERWRIALATLGWSAEEVRAASARPVTDAPVALLDIGDDSGASLVDLNNGAVLAQGLQTVADDAISGVRILQSETALEARGRDGEQLWSTTVPADTTILAVGGALLYLRVGDAIRVHNVVTGDVAEAYDPAGSGIILYPVVMVPTGEVVLTDGRRHLLATSEHDGSSDAEG